MINTNLKKCNKCKKILPKLEFGKAGSGKYYGKYFQSFCNKCVRVGRGEKDKIYHREIRKKEPLKKQIEDKKYKLKYKNRLRANGIAYRAIKNGILKQKKCRDCEREDTHAHHPVYSKPLKVVWLCPIHHKKEHLLLKLTKK